MSNLDYAVKQVVDAWLDEGPMPAYHREQMRVLENRWPTLYRAVQNLVNAHTDAQNSPSKGLAASKTPKEYLPWHTH